MGSEGGYEFECQHGPEECYGNLVQSCTIAHAPDYDTTVRLIVCMMSSSRPNEAGPECFTANGLDYQPIKVLRNLLSLTSNIIVKCIVRTALRAGRAPLCTPLTVRSRTTRVPP